MTPSSSFVRAASCPEPPLCDPGGVTVTQRAGGTVPYPITGSSSQGSKVLRSPRGWRVARAGQNRGEVTRRRRADVSAIAQQTQAHGAQLFLLVNDPARAQAPAVRLDGARSDGALQPRCLSALGRQPDRPALVMGNGMERPLFGPRPAGWVPAPRLARRGDSVVGGIGCNPSDH